MNIAVAGTGYVGLVTGVCLAEKGHEVTCVDVDEKKVGLLSGGKSPIFEAGLQELLQQNMSRLRFTTDYKLAYAHAEVIIIGVGTPEKRDGSANLTYVYGVAGEIAESALEEAVVVVKSTVPIGTNDKIEEYISLKREGKKRLHVASNPEFLAQGTAVRDTLHASRIVIGVEDEFSRSALLRMYDGFESPKVITNRRSAEMIKYASNDFLALKISYINEIANLCEVIGADIEDVAKGMSYDARIGDRFLHAGIGYGGSCFPKDTKALNWLANFNDHEIRTVKAAIEVNDNQKLLPIKKAAKYYHDFRGLTAAVLGLTFKPGTDDLREAPSLISVPILLEDGVHVKAWDPVGVENFKRLADIGDGEIEYCGTVKEALEGADLCLIFTEWPEVKAMDPEDFVRLMKNAVVIDGRNCFDSKIMRDVKGIVYDSIGRAVIDNR